MIWAWVIVFLVALVVLVKGTDWLLSSAEKIGLALGLSPFIVGALIVGVGTSFPELIAALAAVLKGAVEVVPASAVGSNIANILLIIGIAAIAGRRLVVTKSLIDLDLPLLATSTVLMLGVLWDRSVTFVEAILLVVVYGIYMAYALFHKKDDESIDKLPGRPERRKLATAAPRKKSPRPRLMTGDFLWLAAGLAGLLLGAKYLVDSVVELSALTGIGTGVISIVAVSLGTSLPELFVTAQAARQKKSEVALGNIFGSNAFNSLMVIGVPGLFSRLAVDETTFLIGIPAMALATLLFVISGISQRIHFWEGAMYLALYILFIGKVFSLF